MKELKIMKNIDMLRKQLYEKVQHEFDIYIEKMKNSTPEEVLHNSYKLGICEDFLIIFEIDERLNEKQIKALLKVDNLLSKCYEHWRENDCTHVGSIETAIKEFAEDLAKQHEPEKGQKRNQKAGESPTAE